MKSKKRPVTEYDRIMAAELYDAERMEFVLGQLVFVVGGPTEGQLAVIHAILQPYADDVTKQMRLSG